MARYNHFTLERDDVGDWRVYLNDIPIYSYEPLRSLDAAIEKLQRFGPAAVKDWDNERHYHIDTINAWVKANEDTSGTD